MLPSHGNFAVGWIAAIHKEYVAARQVLDEVYEDLEFPRPAEDLNSYTLGRMERHYVVIACLPSGSYGAQAAAEAVERMKSSFPMIRFVLMVGVAGGAPTQADVRLGDVVVGTRVVPYGFGKRTPGGMVFTGDIGLSAGALLTGTQKLAAMIVEGKLDLDFIVRQTFNKSPKITTEYQRPHEKSDRLYKSEYNHGDSCDCQLDCAQNLSRLVNRPERNDYCVEVHCGNIGSADIVVKDALSRDNYAREFRLLCFEMESAGLMSKLPCLPIRGICDYSDSHKNKHWQGYAAATAAVYAKSLLKVIPPENVLQTRITIDKTELERHIRSIIRYVQRVATSRSVDEDSQIRGADNALKKIEVIVDLLKDLSEDHSADISKIEEEVGKHTSDIESARDRLQDIEKGQKELVASLAKITEHIETQKKMSTNIEIEEKWAVLHQKAQEESMMLTKLATFVDEVLPVTTAILGQVGHVTGNENVNTAAEIMENSPRFTALFKSMSDLRSKHSRSSGQRSSKKSNQAREEVAYTTSSKTSFREIVSSTFTSKSNQSQPEEKGNQRLTSESLKTKRASLQITAAAPRNRTDAQSPALQPPPSQNRRLPLPPPKPESLESGRKRSESPGRPAVITGTYIRDGLGSLGPSNRSLSPKRASPSQAPSFETRSNVSSLSSRSFESGPHLSWDSGHPSNSHVNQLRGPPKTPGNEEEKTPNEAETPRMGVSEMRERFEIGSPNALRAHC